MGTDREGRISRKQRAFVERYIVHFNVARAARESGYIEASGYGLIRKPHIQAEIDKRLNELAMRAEEVVARLTTQARGSMSDFLTIDDDGSVKLNVGKGNGALLKKVKLDKYGNVIDVELYDAQAALIQLGKYHELFSDRLKVDANLGGQVQIYIPDNGRNQTTSGPTGSVSSDTG